MSANSHGSTTAAWTAVGVSFVGFFVAAFGMVIPSPIVVAIGLVIAAAGAPVGKMMSAAGFGKKPSTHASIVDPMVKREPVSNGASV
ncbi:HGxxPAAW family protein [Streptacidiphilus sp. MAP5-3]|uniref:HGxxPAAW family protein n=1 Tax=unclassified Streptacidiphilus TaxID=2643834 RepID=UPI003516C957